MHLCPIKKCGATVEDARLMCKAHWELVPPGMARNVVMSYRRLKRGAESFEQDNENREFYRQARGQAIDCVHQILGVTLRT